ncbi:kinase-like protein, partial [Neoconidiobolus thromboides FSU 785]
VFGFKYVLKLKHGRVVGRKSQIQGTLGNIAPEAAIATDASSQFVIGYGTDVWGLGCILYRLIYGCSVFSKKSEEEILKILGDENRAIQEDTKFPSNVEIMRDNRISKMHVPNDLRKLIQDCLTKKRADRITIDSILSHSFIQGI